MKKDIQKFFHNKIRKIEISEPDHISSINNLVALKKHGIYRLEVEFDNRNTKTLLLKIKSNNVLKNGINIVSGKDFQLKKELILHRKILGYNQSYIREDCIYKNIDPDLKKDMIEYYGRYTDRRAKTENLVFRYYSCKEKPMDAAKIQAILDQIIHFHARYLDDENGAAFLQLNRYEKKDYQKARKCLHMMFDLRREENVRYYGTERTEEIHTFIDHIHEQYKRYGDFKTFTHNDFSGRNIFVRDSGILFYDFELACYQIPEHDVAELMIYECNVLSDEEIRGILKRYRTELKKQSRYRISEEEYYARLKFCVREFIVNRLSLLRIVSESIEINFIERLLINSNRLLDMLEEKESE